MKKILFFMGIMTPLLFSAINPQTASKEELMCIKGIGIKKANAIIEYRKKNKLNSIDDLLKIKGFGKSIIQKIKNGEKVAKCKDKQTKQTKKVKKDNTKNSNISTKDKKTIDKK